MIAKTDLKKISGIIASTGHPVLYFQAPNGTNWVRNSYDDPRMYFRGLSYGFGEIGYEQPQGMLYLHWHNHHANMSQNIELWAYQESLSVTDYADAEIVEPPTLNEKYL